MPEVSSDIAGQIIGVTRETIRVHVDGGRLKARREGLRKVIKVDIDSLREFAEQYQYRFNEDLANKLAQ